MSWIYVLLASIVEGLTEFLPISSTGHLILLNKLLNIEQTTLISSFNIFIQSGAILAVIHQYKNELTNNKKLLLNLLFSFLPTAIIGFTLYPFIKNYLLDNVFIISISLFVGGIIILLLPKTDNSGKLTFKKSFIIGTFQSLSIVPGTSRALMSILGGLVTGQSLRDSIRYSFLLAVPTILSATLLDLYKSRQDLTNQTEYIPHFIVGFVLSFLFAKIVVSKLTNLISNYKNFYLFGFYRIILSLIILLVIFYL